MWRRTDEEVYPQKLVNLRVREKRPLEDLPAVRREIRAAEAAFAGAGHVLVRYSGTEALARVMVEAADAGLVEEFARRISEAVRTDLGAPPD